MSSPTIWFNHSAPNVLWTTIIIQFVLFYIIYRMETILLPGWFQVLMLALALIHDLIFFFFFIDKSHKEINSASIESGWFQLNFCISVSFHTVSCVLNLLLFRIYTRTKFINQFYDTHASTLFSYDSLKLNMRFDLCFRFDWSKKKKKHFVNCKFSIEMLCVWMSIIHWLSLFNLMIDLWNNVTDKITKKW